MIIVAGTLKLDAQSLAALRDLAQDTVRATRAEDGCIVYAFAEDLSEPGLLRIYEEWETMEALAAHGRADHIARWRKALSEHRFTQDLKTVEAGATAKLG